nr:hemin uptake protein HemP [Oricola sp.]
MMEQDSNKLGAETMDKAERTTIDGKTVYESSNLFRGSTEIGIEHEGAIYRLKITRQGKLILNK